MLNGSSMQKSLIFLTNLFLLFISASPLAQVEPPNYNFSLNSLQVFYPKSKLSTIQNKHGPGELIENSTSAKIYKFYLAQIRYKFPVFVQVKDGQVIDFFARLPSYFLHDVFHQSLINKMGKQNEYRKKDNSAIYIWNNVEGNKFYYNASCTLTCFPIYLSGVSTESFQNAETNASILNRLAISHFK